MELLKVQVETDGGPWAEHNYPCTVCRDKPAVLLLNTGIMHPCWECQREGWQLRKKKFLPWVKPEFRRTIK